MRKDENLRHGLDGGHDLWGARGTRSESAKKNRCSVRPHPLVPMEVPPACHEDPAGFIREHRLNLDNLRQMFQSMYAETLALPPVR